MIDLWIIAIFLFITLIVGIWQGRGIKDFRSFSIADRNYSTGVLVATISATLIGGESSQAVAEQAYIVGMFFFFIMLGDMVDNLILAKFIAPKIGEFRDCISVGDIAEKIYGKNAKIIIGVTGVIALVAVLAAQIAAMGQVFHYFLDITPMTGIIIGATIIIVYSYFGGVKAVAITDVIQFIVLIAAIPMICNVGLAKVGGYTKLMNALPASHISLLPPKEEFWKYLNLFIISSIPGLNAGLVQRLLMAKDGNQARKSLICSAIIYIPFYKMVCIIGLLSLVINPKLDPMYAMPDLINNILPTGLKGIAICGMLAIAMSTADSIINVWSILIVHDVIKPIYKKELSDETQLKLARFFTIVIGIWGCIVASKFKTIFNIILLGRFFWKPIVVVGLFAGMAGFRASKKSFYLGIIAGVATVLLSPNLNYEAVFRAIVANAIVFFGSHYYYKKFRPSELASHSAIKL
jgi:SSS family solute:Na+ symporter